MSYDFATGNICHHEVFLETSTVDPLVHNTVRFQRNPSSRRVFISVDGSIIPPDGLYSIPSITFTRPEPYRLKVGKNDFLYVSIGNEPPRLVQVPPGDSVPARDVVSNLQRQIPELKFDSVNGRVRISARQPSKNLAFTFHDPRWTDKTSSMPNTPRILGCYAELGIQSGRAVSGIRVFPSWKIIADPNSFVDEKIIVFDDPIPNRFPTVQITYMTNAENCRRCYGSRFEYDYSVKDSTYEIVMDTDLLVQEFDKFLFTRIGSHWKWPWLGSAISSRIGGKSLTASGQSQAFITMDVTQSFKTYQDLKRQQDNLLLQQVSDAEYPISLGGLTVQLSTIDPTIAIVSADITSRSQVTVPLKRMVGNPSPFYVDGNNDPFRQFG